MAAGIRVAAHTPTDEARAWVTVVAMRMPSRMPQGRRYREAIDNATSWVLSPISASATTRNELSSATITSHARRSGSGLFELLLTRHARGGIGNREKAFRRNGGPTLGADSILAVRHPRQRDLETPGPLGQPRRADAHQLLMRDSLRDIAEAAAGGIGR